MKYISLVTALVVAPLTFANAQSCVGIPNDARGSVAYGLSGTDGASGTALSLGYRTSRASVMVNRTSWSTGMVDAMVNWAGHAALPLGKSSLCVVSGLEGGRFDTRMEPNTFWVSSDPAGGQYSMLAVPVVLQTGAFYQLFDVGVQPFAVGGAVFQSEHFDPRNGAATGRSQVVPRLGVGLTLIVKRVVIRSTLVNDNGPKYSLAGWHSFASIQVMAGFRY